MRKRTFGIHGVTVGIKQIGNGKPEEKQTAIVNPLTGYVAHRFTPGKTAELIATVAPDCMLYGINIEPTPPHSVRELDGFPTEADECVYTERVAILKGKGGRCYPNNKDNVIRLVGVMQDGVCVMFEVAVVSQNGTFFLTTQEMFRHQAFTNGKGVTIPQLESVSMWKDLGKFLAESMAEHASEISIPDLGRYVQDQRKFVDGQVLWYSLQKQMGCIFTGEGTARVHWTNITTRRPDCLRYLLQGERVSYRLEKPRDAIPGHTNGFRWEAHDVSVIA